MNAAARRWKVLLTATAKADFQGILAWTVARFGETQARAYAQTLSAALEALTAGPTAVGAKDRTDIAQGLFNLHVARKGRKGRHFVLFRIGQVRGREAIEVLRILHDGVDLQRHLPPTDDDT